MSLETLNFISVHFLEFLAVALIGLNFFREELRHWMSKKLGLKNGNGAEAKMDKLVEHFNHDTTSLLTSILGELKWVRKEQEIQSKSINTVISRVEEMIKYGVPERK